MCHDVLIEGRERDRSLRARWERRQDKKEDGNKGQSSHKGMEIIGGTGTVNHQEAIGLPPWRDIASARPDCAAVFREAEPKAVKEPPVRTSSAVNPPSSSSSLENRRNNRDDLQN